MKQCSIKRKPLIEDSPYQGGLLYAYHSRLDKKGNLHRYCRTIIINNDKKYKFHGEQVAKCEICGRIIQGEYVKSCDVTDIL